MRRRGCSGVAVALKGHQEILISFVPIAMSKVHRTMRSTIHSGIYVSSPKDSSVLLSFFAFLDELFAPLSFAFLSICTFSSSSCPTAFRLFDLNGLDTPPLADDENESPCVPVLELDAVGSLAPVSARSPEGAPDEGSGSGGRPFSTQDLSALSHSKQRGITAAYLLSARSPPRAP